MALVIQYSSAPCGAGKTYQIVQTARKLVEEGHQVLVLQPTKLLIDCTKAEYFDNKPDAPLVKIFHADKVGDNVAKQLAEYLANPEDSPQIVFASHQVLPRLPFLPCARDWDLIIDETIQVDQERTHLVPKTHSWLTNHLEVQQYDGIYGRVLARKKSALEELARNESQDELLDQFRETAGLIASRHWDCFANVEHYHRLINGNSERLTIHATLNPSVVRGFRSVFIAAANFEDSAMYHLWGKQGVSFQVNNNFSERLLYGQHENGHIATIHYVTDRNWSRNLIESSCEGGSPLEMMRDAAYPIISGRRFLWQANKSVPVTFMPEGQRLPNNPLGLDAFSDVHNVVFLSALNPFPAHYRFLQQQGLSSEQIDRQGYCSIGYQAVMRTSLRNPANKDPKNIIVPDRRLAEYLAEVLPGATVRKIDAGIPDSVRSRGRKRTHATSAERSRSHRQREKEKRLALIRQLFLCNRRQDENEGGCDLDRDTKLSNGIAIKLNSIFVTQHRYYATIYKSKKSATPAAYLSCANQDGFIAGMAACHMRSYDSKEANPLFSPAIFDPDRLDDENPAKPTRRGSANIVYLQNIVLDFEDGDLRPEELPQLFPDLTMIVTNTFRHTVEKPRYRVIILTSQRMTPQVYEALFDAIEGKLKDAGYVANPAPSSRYKKSGLDRSKRSAASLFYLPCQAERPDQSFFEVCDGPARRPLDPSAWVRNIFLPFAIEREVEPVHTKHGAVDEIEFDAAVSKWRGANPGQGNHEFFLLARRFQNMGLPAYEIRSILAQETVYGRSVRDRRNQIPSIIVSLAKGAWR